MHAAQGERRNELIDGTIKRPAAAAVRSMTRSPGIRQRDLPHFRKSIRRVGVVAKDHAELSRHLVHVTTGRAPIASIVPSINRCGVPPWLVHRRSGIGFCCPGQMCCAYWLSYH